MVRIVVETGHSITLQGVTFTGPLSFDVESFELGSDTLTTGVCLVGASGEVQVSEVHPDFASFGLWVCLFFVLGINFSAKVFR
jgi:hypothetical protein